MASWLDITTYATRYAPSDVAVEHKGVGDLGEPGAYEYEWLEFTGRFGAPVEDYGQDLPNGAGAPAYRVGVGDDDRVEYEYDVFKCERYWRGWLCAVKDAYEALRTKLPSVEDQVPPESQVRPETKPAQVEPDDIRFKDLPVMRRSSLWAAGHQPLKAQERAASAPRDELRPVFVGD